MDSLRFLQYTNSVVRSVRLSHRYTFATEHLRHGVDIRTLQSWMGHRDIKSTMVYLKGVQFKDALAKVNAGALARYVA